MENITDTKIKNHNVN